MNTVGILASDTVTPGHPNEVDDTVERDEQMSKLVPAFAEQEIRVEIVRWRDASARAEEFDAYLPLFVWDYFEGNERAFLQEMKTASHLTQVLNDYETLKWNADKSYLDDLARAGAPVIRTLQVSRVTEREIQAAFEELNTDTLVIKPKVGGGAWRQVLYKRGEPFPDVSKLPPAEALVQPFLPGVVEEGEYSLLYFDGEFSHGLVKRPQSGDYRVQSFFGGSEETITPSAAELASARSVLAAVDSVPLYARVDLVRGLDGELKLIELEMIEPYLYLPHTDGEDGDNVGAKTLAAALRRRLGVRG